MVLGVWLAPPPSPRRTLTVGYDTTRRVETSNWPPAATSTWPPVGTFSWPRTGRGGLGGVRGADRQRGLIPARAGRSRGARPSKALAWAHPRAGGAVASGSWAHAWARGSSPRGRGGHGSPIYEGRCKGLIPARAGRSLQGAPIAIGARAHPRAGGAVLESEGAADSEEGSSPRGRGGPGRVRGVVRWVGLIPARAGRSFTAPTPPACARAHPRAGGAVTSQARVRVGRWGSSPRGRGGPHVICADQRASGLIPARAGRSRRCRTRGRSGRAHPRAGGAVTSLAISRRSA